MLKGDINIIIKNIVNSKINFEKRSKFYEIEFYNNYYGLPSFDLFDHVFGYFLCNNRRIWGHIIIPKNIKLKGTVIIVHGYQSHSGDQKNVIWHYLSKDKVVATFDLPGHGLSDGLESFIEDFKEYADVLSEFIKQGKIYFNGEVEFFGHSQGCAIISMYLKNKEHINVTYFAPLVRLKYRLFIFFLLRLPAYKIIGLKVNVSADKEYNIFAKKDPLQSKIITIKWLEAVERFYKDFMNYEKYHKSIKITVIQGEEDIVVDWKFNIKALRSKFEKVSFIKIKKANHQLQNEALELRHQIFFNC